MTSSRRAPDDPEARAWFEATDAIRCSRRWPGGDDYELLFTVARGVRAGCAVARLARGLTLTRIGIVTATPRSCCGAATDGTRRCPRASRISAGRMSGADLPDSLWRKVLATLIVVTAFVFLYETTDPRFARSALRPRVRRPSVGPLPAPGHAPDVRRHRVLQGHDDRLRRERAIRYRGRRSRAAARRIGRPGRRAGHAQRRRLHHHGHRSQGQGPPPRSLHVELPRGARVRPHRRVDRRAAPGLEPAGELARHHRPPVPPARGDRARAGAGLPQVPPATLPDVAPSVNPPRLVPVAI